MPLRPAACCGRASSLQGCVFRCGQRTGGLGSITTTAKCSHHSSEKMVAKSCKTAPGTGASTDNASGVVTGVKEVLHRFDFSAALLFVSAISEVSPDQTDAYALSLVAVHRGSGSPPRMPAVCGS